MARGQRPDSPALTTHARTLAGFLATSRRDALILSADTHTAAERLVAHAALDDDPEVELIRAGLAGADADERADRLVELAAPLTTRLLDIADAASKRNPDDLALRRLIRQLLPGR